MVKVKGPLLSQDATGKLGNDLQLSHWKGRNVLGRRRRPSQPRTEAQQAHRILMGFLGSQWKALTPQQRVTWEYLANHNNIPPYNAFIAANMARYRNCGPNYPRADLDHHHPSKIHPPAEALAPGGWNAFTITPLSKAVLLRWDMQDVPTCWGITVHHADHPAGPLTFQNLIALIAYPGPGWLELTIHNLQPGPYQCVASTFSVDGNTITWWYPQDTIVLP